MPLQKYDIKCLCWNLLYAAELEATLGVNEPTLAEYIIAKYDGAKGELKDFRAVLSTDAGIDDVHIDRLHALIQTLTVRWLLRTCFHIFALNVFG
jgi:hypothetical protein